MTIEKAVRVSVAAAFASATPAQIRELIHAPYADLVPVVEHAYAA